MDGTHCVQDVGDASPYEEQDNFSRSAKSRGGAFETGAFHGQETALFVTFVSVKKIIHHLEVP